MVSSILLVACSPAVAATAGVATESIAHAAEHATTVAGSAAAAAAVRTAPPPPDLRRTTRTLIHYKRIALTTLTTQSATRPGTRSPRRRSREVRSGSIIQRRLIRLSRSSRRLPVPILRHNPLPTMRTSIMLAQPRLNALPMEPMSTRQQGHDRPQRNIIHTDTAFSFPRRGIREIRSGDGFAR